MPIISHALTSQENDRVRVPCRYKMTQVRVPVCRGVSVDRTTDQMPVSSDASDAADKPC